MELFLWGEEIIQSIAVQIGWYSWRMRLILLAYWAAMRRFQNQVHRRAAEIAEGCFLLRSNRERRLDRKPHAFDNRLKLRSMAPGLQEIYVLIRHRAFYLAASHRQIKNYLICALCDFAVKIKFGQV